MTRRATNLAAVLAYPGYYHGRPIVIVGKGLDDGTIEVRDRRSDERRNVAVDSAVDAIIAAVQQ